MCGPHARESCANDDMPSSPIVTASPTHGENVDPCCNVAAPACNRSHPSPHRQPSRLRSIMHPAQRLTVAVRLCALVHEGVAVLQELHRRLLDVLDSLAGRHGCRGTELRENLPREERHDRSNATCLVQAGPIEVEAMVLWCPRVLPPRSRTWLLARSGKKRFVRLGKCSAFTSLL